MPAPLHVAALFSVLLPEQLVGPQVVPALVGAQMPTDPAFVHETHGPPVQALLQQTPATQKPLWQPALLAQAAPSGAAETHAPLTQRRPEAHCVSFAHDVKHVTLEQV